MKRILFLFVLLAHLQLLSCGADHQTGPEYYTRMAADYGALIENGTLNGIEGRIDQTFAQAMVGKSAEPLRKLGAELEEVYAKKPVGLVAYWLGYLHYYEAIYHGQQEDAAASEQAVKRGIEYLEGIKKKNSEDLALLALLQSYSIQFTTGMKAGFLSGKVKKNAKLALELNPKNIRAQFVLASNDYYTPAQYGGGELAEGYLLKAIEMPNQEVPNDMLPAWGKEEAYEMLVNLYMQQENWDEANRHLQAASKLYPDSYTLNRLASRLVRSSGK